ncbi:hypothetical protein ABFT23_02975 [Nocardioides sp. C4-1]|uniref:hypothetical protein n=1 Tax=Nocardioides sp. C4-1 TaxID=3151851 RepID=UPI003264BF2F
MSRTVYLHVGAPKTGTTYLQHRLALNTRTLAQHDVHYPSRHALADVTLSQFRAALDLMGQDWGGPSGHAQGAWDATMRRVRRLDGTVVISHEVLATATTDDVRRAMRDLRGSEVHVVYSARDLARQVPAAWQEHVKQGGGTGYTRFARRMTRGNMWFARAFNLPQVLSTWGEGLPPERVHVVTVPHERGPNGDELWLRFCRALGIDPAWAPVESDVVNVSMGIAETQVLRRMNRRLEHADRKDTAYARIVREKLAQGLLANRRGSRVQLPPEHQAWATEQAERWIEWIAGSGVDVVGDVADLRPRELVSADEWIDPNRAPAKAQLGAALDALALMTREAARREDPEARISARVRQKWRAR